MPEMNNLILLIVKDLDEPRIKMFPDPMFPTFWLKVDSNNNVI